MGSKALLTVDLSYVRAHDQEMIFNLELAKREWKKIYENTPIWKASLNNDISEELVVKRAKEDIAHDAQAAGIKRYGAEIYFTSGYSVTL